MAQWNVLLFAHLREGFGPSVTIEAEPTVAAVMAALTARGIDVSTARLAADDVFLSPGATVALGAQLSVIPPVSGG